MKSKIRILHLEDDSTDAELIRDKLKKEPLEFEFKTVITKNEFVEQLNEFIPDLVLSDYKLPDINGKIAIDIVKESKPEIPVIIVTGTLDEETAVDLMKTGAADYVLKENLTRLIPAVHGVLEKKRLQQEKAHAEKQMLIANERMQYLLFSTSALIYSAKAEGNYLFTFMSENVYQMTRFLTKEVLVVPGFWADHIHPEDRRRVLEESEIVFEQGRLIHEYRFQRKDKSYIWLRDEKKLIRDPSDEPLEIIGHIVNITERKKAEMDLQRSEDLYRSVVTSMAEGVIVQDADGSIRAFNKRAEDILGLSREQMTGRTFNDNRWQAVHEDGTPFPGETHPAMVTLRTGKPCSNVIMGVHKPDGSLIWISINSQPIFETSKIKPSAVVISFNEITDRFIAEKSLKNSEKRFRTVFNDAAIGMAIVDLKGRPLRVNPALEKMLGYNGDELAKMIFADFTHEDDIDKDCKLFKQLTAGKIDNYFMEKRYIKKDGTIVWGGLAVSVIKDTDGKILYAVGMVEDITRKKIAEENLKRSEERYRKYFINDISGIYLSTPEGEIIDCNPSFIQIFGFESLEDVKTTSAYDLYPSTSDRDKIIKLIKERGQLINFEVEFCRIDGNRLYCIQNVFGIFDADGKLIQLMGYLFDITERKQLEEQLVQSQKLEGIGKLAGGIAHDFNNLLTVINGYADLLSSQLKDNDSFKKAVSQIKFAGERAAALTDQLLAFSRRKIINPKIINLNDSIKNIEKMINRLIGENIQIKCILNDDLGNIKVDPGQMDQIMINMVVNARDAMPNGGKITIETKNTHLNEEYTNHHIAVVPGDYVLLAISDTGHGMDEKTKSRIFEPFFTTKESGRGTGLGLSTVYGIVKQAGGNIWVYSERGKGTTFKIYLPVSKDTVSVSKEKSVSAKFFKGSETVLVVEDDIAVRELTCNFLTNYGYNVIEAKHVDHAIELAQRTEKPLHLLITDVVMPKLSGRQLSDKLIELHPDLKVLYVTGYTDNAIVHHGILDDGVNLLSKPFSPINLAKKVREVLDS